MADPTEQPDRRGEHERAKFELDLPNRLARLGRVPKHEILPYDWTTRGQVERRRLFAGGHWYGCILTCIAVVDGLSKFVAVRTGLPRYPSKFRKRVEVLESRKSIDSGTAEAMRTVWGTDRQRNTFVHFNPDLETNMDRLEKRAEECMRGVNEVEASLFAYGLRAGSVVPKRPELWPDGETPGVAPVYVDFT